MIALRLPRPARHSSNGRRLGAAAWAALVLAAAALPCAAASGPASATATPAAPAVAAPPSAAPSPGPAQPVPQRPAGPSADAAPPAAVPALHTRVTDLTGTLDASRRAQLEQRLAALEQRSGAQVAVLMVPSTAPDTIEQYATRVFDQWRLGRGQVDDGVLLVLAKEDRTLRIEVGYGLEGAIPDAVASRIIREQIVPRLQAGDYGAGIEAGVLAIEGLIDGEPLPAPAPGAGRQDDAGGWETYAGLAAVALMALPAVFAGVLAGALAWFYSGSLLWAAAGAVGGFALSALLGALGIKRRLGAAARRGGRGGGGGFGGGFGGGGFGGGGGGFGGGGGRSGGGGASGRW